MLCAVTKEDHDRECHVLKISAQEHTNQQGTSCHLLIFKHLAKPCMLKKLVEARRKPGGGGGYLAVEEHVLADGKAQFVLRRLQGEAEEAGVVAELDLVDQLEGDFLLGIERNQLLPLLGCLQPRNKQVKQRASKAVLERPFFLEISTLSIGPFPAPIEHCTSNTACQKSGNGLKASFLS